MTTIADMIETIKGNKYKKAILEHVVELLDSSLLASDPTKRKILLTDDRLCVPEDAIEDYIQELNQTRAEHESAIKALMEMEITKGVQ